MPERAISISWVADESVLLSSNLDYNPPGKELFLPLFLFRGTARSPQTALMLTVFQGLLEIARNGEIIGYGKHWHLSNEDQAYCQFTIASQVAV